MSELQCFTEIAGLRAEVNKLRSQGEIIGLVPTMGNLHAGHMKLVAVARQRCDSVICSIFVNPMQFGPDEDLDTYPRTLEQDKNGLREAGCDFLFYPAVNEIYPQGLQTQTIVSVPELGTSLCGSSRPGHFDGVSTVVIKLLNICQPDVAFFGLKDYQQFLIVQKMVADLLIPVEVVGVETEREPDGLAISSRNNYLTGEQRQLAPILYRTLQETVTELTAGSNDFRALEASGRKSLSEAGLEPDYFAICNASSLQSAQGEDSDLVILAAANLGKTRLIDNMRVAVGRR